jgi:hypothetical protein
MTGAAKPRQLCGASTHRASRQLVPFKIEEFNEVITVHLVKL